MLRFLTIKRLAVIDSIEIEFGPGLNVLTGETGAGKSILVEAVGLLIGGRASGDLVRTGEDAASVEAIFETAGEELIVRREVTAEGRSRAFINGDLATAGALKDRSAQLIELHGQREHQTLLDPAMHLAVLDTFAGLERLRAPVAETFRTMRAAERELARVRNAASDRAARQELIEFQLTELDRAAPTPGEDEELASLRQVLANAERVERLCTESYASLYESDGAVLARLGGVWKRVAELAAIDPQFRPYLDARDGIKSELEDLALFLRRYAEGIQASPARLQQVEERLALLERLKRKHGPALADVVYRRETLRQECSELQRSEERIAELIQAYEGARELYRLVAASLSTARRAAAISLSEALETFLAELVMEKARFEIRFADEPLPESSWTPEGFDRAEFFLSPNPGEDLRPLARIVSGGELSRVMLAIKTLTFRARLADEATDRVTGAGAPGLIFDEVDAGIGGRVADVVGRKLRALGSAFQVLCITHLPQIAAYADTHFQIEKRVANGRTHTRVTRLDADARVEELGRMLGGATVTDPIRASAREMLAGRWSPESRDRRGGQARGESERAKGETPNTAEDPEETARKRRTR
jgi:DNA repair protein RecN (Recombination protein N)